MASQPQHKYSRFVEGEVYTPASYGDASGPASPGGPRQRAHTQGSLPASSPTAFGFGGPRGCVEYPNHRKYPSHPPPPTRKVTAPPAAAIAPSQRRKTTTPSPLSRSVDGESEEFEEDEGPTRPRPRPRSGYGGGGAPRHSANSVPTLSDGSGSEDSSDYEYTSSAPAPKQGIRPSKTATRFEDMLLPDTYVDNPASQNGHDDEDYAYDEDGHRVHHHFHSRHRAAQENDAPLRTSERFHALLHRGKEVVRAWKQSDSESERARKAARRAAMSARYEDYGG